MLAPRPTYRAANASGVAPARRGTKKKIAKVTMLTMSSIAKAPITRLMMYVTTVPGSGPRPDSPTGDLCLHPPI
ncbi:hypothetical protein GCM10020219_008140 [Nonomuraea dietziae]